MDKNLNKSAYSLFARSKYDNAQEVQNLRCAFLCALSTRTRTFFLTLVLALTVLATTGMAGMNVYAETGTVRVATFDQLRVALEDTQGVKKIVVDPQAAADDGDVIYSVENDENSDSFYIGFDAPLTVSHDITITIADDVNVFFARSDSFRRDQGNPALFNIDRTGNLKLEGLITMTGEEVTTAYNDREFVFSIKSRDGTGDDNDAWNRGQVLKGGFYIQNNGGEYNLGDDVILEDFHTTDDVEGVEPISEKETNSLFGAKNSDEEEAVTAPAPKRLMKNALMGNTPTRGGDTAITTSAGLKAALQNGTNPIILDSTLTKKVDGVDKYYFPIDEPLEVSNTVEIKTKNGKEIIIARSTNFTPKSDKPAIFNVVSGGNLTLSEQVTMTGAEITKPKIAKLKLTSEGKYFAIKEYGSQVYAKRYILTTADNATGAVELSVDTNGYLMHKSGETTYRFMQSFLTADQGYYSNSDFRVKALANSTTLESSFASSLEEGKTYVAVTPTNNGDQYIKLSGDSLGLTTNLSEAIKFTAEPVSGANPSDEATALKIDKKIGDGAWTADKVLPGGYFIHATGGGKVTLNSGVSLQDLNTAADVEKAAPVYIGGGSKFNMTGGSIKDNTIGYGPSDSNVFNENLSDGPVVGRGAGYVENAGIRKAVQEAKMTNTAGGIIFKGNGTTADITGGTIEGNKADAGGIIVTDEAVVNFGVKDDATKNPGIDSNIGWHHAGAAQVEDGGLLNMYGGHMNNNVAWFKGGAVVVTEFGTNGYVEFDDKKSPTNRMKAGKFLMDGGTLDGNYAFVRAGAIEVESNSVVLKTGTISNNKCKSLGGAIYVEGDYSDYSYTLVINQGYIHNNSAIGAVNDQGDNGVDKKLVNGVLTNSTSAYGDGHHKDADFPNKHSGNGGGVWLCPLGGTSVFTSNGDQKVVINNNTAYSTNKTRWNLGWGHDFYLSTGKGAALLQNLEGSWKYDRQPYPNEGENLGTIDANGKVLNGPVGLYNSSTNLTGSGIVITGNRSRDGGGIAANGTVILGIAKDVYRFNSEIDITKTWIGTDGEEVKIELMYKDNNGNTKRLRDMDTEQEYTIDLNENTGTNKPEDAVIYRTGAWKAKALIPAFIYEKDSNNNIVGDPIYLYKIKKSDGSYFNLTTTAGIKELHDYIGRNGSKDLTVEWNLFIKETVQSVDGETKYVVERTVKSSIGKTETKPVHLGSPVVGENGQLVNGFDVNFTTVTIQQEIENSLLSTNVKLYKAREGEKATKLKDAEFALYEAKVAAGNDDVNVNAANGAIFVKNSRPSRFGDNNSEIAPLNSTAIMSDNNGEIALNNLRPGTYLLFETKAPAGYERAKSPWFLRIGKDGATTVVAMPVANDGKVIHNTTDVYNSSGNSYAARTTSLNAWVKDKYWYKDWFDVTPTSDNLSEGKSVSDVVMKADADGSGRTLADKTLTNKPFTVYKKNNSSPAVPLNDVEFEVWGAQVQDGKLKYGHQLSDHGTVTTSNGGVLDLSKSIYYARTNGWGTTPGESISGLANTNVLMLKEKTEFAAYRTPTVPWLIIYNQNTGSIEIKEYTDKYTSDTSPWDYSKFTKTNALYNAGTGATTGNSTLVNERTEIKLTKIDGVTTSKKLGGAEFTLYHACDITFNADGTINSPAAITVKKTNGNVDVPLKDTIVSSTQNDKLGEVNLGSLDPGAYLLFEKKAPEGYQRRKTPWLIVVLEDGTYRMATYAGKNYSTGQSIYAHEYAGWDILNSNIGTVGWNSNEFNEIAKTASDYGKLKNAPQELEIIKKDSKEEIPLIGVTFNLYEGRAIKQNGWRYEVANTTPVNDELLRSGAEGKFTLPALTPAASDNEYGYNVYLLFEVDPLSGYQKPDAPWGIRVDKDGGVELWRLKKEGDKGYNAESVAQYSADTALSNIEILCTDLVQVYPFVITNERKPIELTKVDENGAAITSGATFVLTKTALYNGGNNWYVMEGRGHDDKTLEASSAAVFGATRTYTTNASGKLVIDDLPHNGHENYLLFETSAPDGFTRTRSPWLIRITKDDATGREWSVWKLNDNYKNSYMDSNGETQTIPDTDGNQQKSYEMYWPGGDNGWFESIDVNTDGSYNVQNEPKYLTKVDLNTINSDSPLALSGAKFKLYGTHKNTFGSYKYIRKDESKLNLTLETTGTDGKIKLPSRVTTQPGEYFLVEDTNGAPSGYEAATYPWLIKVDDNGNIKVLATTTNYSHTNNYGVWWKYENTNASADQFKEVSYSNKNMIPNTPMPVHLKKVDGHTKAGLGGARFELWTYRRVQIGNTGSNKYYFVNKVGETTEPSAEGTGIFYLPTTTPDLYLLKEVTPPDGGYTVSETPWLIRINNPVWDSREQKYKYYIETWEMHENPNEPGSYLMDDPCEHSEEIPNYPSVNLTKVDLATVDVSQVTDGTGKVTKVTYNINQDTVRLNGVGFKLYNVSGNAWTQGTQVTIDGEDSNKIIWTKKVGNKDGVLELGNLGKNKRYILVETNPKEGYTLPTKEWHITIGNDGKISKIEAAVGTNGAYVETNAVLTNVQIYDLPKTGGMGTYWFMIIGMGMMTFAVTTLITRKFAKKKL